MQGIAQKCECPICGASYDTNPHACTCGFEGLVFLPDRWSAQAQEAFKERVSAESFRIYKFAKQVYYGETVYEKSDLVTIEQNGYVSVDEAVEQRGLAVVDPVCDAFTVAASGLIALRSNVRALILNTHAARSETLEESSVETLLLGHRFSELKGGLIQYAPLRYIWADGKNKHFAAEDNVLFDKERTRLYLYARSRPDAEYRVPEGVKRLEPYSFFSPNHLERLYLPRGIEIDRDAFGHHNAYWNRDGVFTKVKPAFEIIYY